MAVDAPPTTSRPREITLAVLLLYANAAIFILGIPLAIWLVDIQASTSASPPDRPPMISAIAFGVGGAALCAVLGVLIGRGRNRARLTVIVLAWLGAIGTGESVVVLLLPSMSPFRQRMPGWYVPLMAGRSVVAIAVAVTLAFLLSRPAAKAFCGVRPAGPPSNDL